MLEISMRPSTKNTGGNSPLVQTEVEISNMEVDGIDHVSLYFAGLLPLLSVELFSPY